MAKPTGKIKLNGLHGQRTTNPAGQRRATAPNQPASTKAAAQPTANSSSASSEPNSKPKTFLSIFPGGPMLWLLLGLAIGLGVWIGGRQYLRHILAERLSNAQSEQVALESIDALLRLDANATVEVSRGLAHPEFMVANAAFRALSGQLEAWAKLDPSERLERMHQVVIQLEQIPSDIDQDHRILVSGLASRIYADTLSNRETGAAQVLETCRRILAKNDPAAVGARLARLEQPAAGPDLAKGEDATNPVPPPLPPLNNGSQSSTSLTPEPNDQAPADYDRPATGAKASMSSMPRMSVGESSRPTSNKPALRLTASEPTESRSSSAGLLELAPEPNLAEDSSSRSRVIPQKVTPLTMESEPSPEEVAEQEAATIGGMDELPIDQLVRLLSSLQPRISQAAALSLRKKGMPERNLNVAVQLATGSAEVRNGLLTELVSRSDIDPRPWLLWMATDGQDQVRLHAIGLLKPLADQDVRRQLRLLLNKERDEQVAATIRHVLAQ